MPLFHRLYLQQFYGTGKFKSRKKKEPMSVSVFQMFKIGIGPSSSHTMGPMRAAKLFLEKLDSMGVLSSVGGISIELYGSLALTGIGHGTDKALQLGLAGYEPDGVNPDDIQSILDRIKKDKMLSLLGRHRIGFDQKNIILLRRKTLPIHPNGMCFYSETLQGEPLFKERYYSFGGGFVATEEEATALSDSKETPLPYPFGTAQELLDICENKNWSIAQMMLENEKAWGRSTEEINTKLDGIWAAMVSCIERGIQQEGVLPGHLKVKRRASGIYRELLEGKEASLRDPLTVLDWVNLYALAVNEENASGSRVVTAPTNGAAGIIPAVLRYYEKFCQGTPQGIRDFLLTAGAIGILYKKNASISGAEVGCQGEVGVACSMAAGGLAAALTGDPRKVEQAAEIGMEHNLGLTCDPVGGLVQIPCIERNAMGAVKAINATRIAMRGDGSHFVSLDSVIKTMRETGADMKTQYKETSRGGLAVNVIEC
jgi:L-serine dehydratase